MKVIHGRVAGNELLHYTAANTDDLASDATVAPPQRLQTGEIWLFAMCDILLPRSRKQGVRTSLQAVVKSVPLEAWTGPEGSRKLRFPDFVTTAQDGGKVVSFTHRPLLPPGNTPGTHFC